MKKILAIIMLSFMLVPTAHAQTAEPATTVQIEELKTQLIALLTEMLTQLRAQIDALEKKNEVLEKNQERADRNAERLERDQKSSEAKQAPRSNGSSKTEDDTARIKVTKSSGYENEVHHTIVTVTAIEGDIEILGFYGTSIEPGGDRELEDGDSEEYLFTGPEKVKVIGIRYKAKGTEEEKVENI